MSDVFVIYTDGSKKRGQQIPNIDFKAPVSANHQILLWLRKNEVVSCEEKVLITKIILRN